MDHSNRPIRGLIPVYANQGDYEIEKVKVAKEELYLSKSLQKAQPEKTPTPQYDAIKIASIIQSFLDM